MDIVTRDRFFYLGSACNQNSLDRHHFWIVARRVGRTQMCHGSRELLFGQNRIRLAGIVAGTGSR